MIIEARPYDRNYEITDAMFGLFRGPGGARFGFKLIAWTALAFGLVYAVTLPPVIRGYAAMFTNVAALESEDPEEIMAVLSGLGAMLGSLMLLSLASLFIVAMARAAFFRSYFFGDQGGVFPFRLGGDEGRQLLAVLGYYALYIVAYMGIFIVIGLITGLLSVALGEAGAIIGALLSFFGIIGGMVGLVWLGVRLQPAGALTALNRKTHIMAARKISANRFWGLFGALVVAGVIGYVASYAFIILGGAIGLSGLFGEGGITEALMSEDPDAIGQSFQDATSTTGFMIRGIIGLLIAGAGYSVFTLMLAGPAAFFTKQWAESDPQDVF